jgi:hypothetical protein
MKMRGDINKLEKNSLAYSPENVTIWQQCVRDGARMCSKGLGRGDHENEIIGGCGRRFGDGVGEFAGVGECGRFI